MRSFSQHVAKQHLQVNYVIMILLAMMLSVGDLAVAQTPEAPAEPAPAEAPAPEPTSVEPAPAPVEPAPVVIEPAPVEQVPVEPAPEPAPVEPAPEEPAPAGDDAGQGTGDVAPAPEAPVDPGVPAEEAAPEGDVNAGESEEDPAETSGNDPGGELPSTPDVSPTVAPSPTVVPSPTPTPTSISWSQPDPISCELLAGNAQALALGDTATWRCTAAIQAETAGDLPADLSILWTLNASYAGDDVRFALPPGSLATIQQPDSVPGGIAEQVVYRSNWTDGQSLVVDVTVTRTSCVVGDAQLKLTSDIALETADTGVIIANVGKEPQKTLLTSTAAPNGEPTVRFDGPISFEALSATSAGLDSTIAHGTARVVIEGEWNRCSTWALDLAGTVNVSATTPARLRVVSINSELLPGGACDLSAGCVITTLPASGSAATPLRLTIGLELELHQFTPVGDVGITVQIGANRVETTQ